MACTIAAFLAGTPDASAELLVSQPFSGSAVPSGWVMNGREGAATWNNDPNAGTAKTTSDWFVSDMTGSFLRLTENAPDQRTTAIYNGTTFRTDQDFTIRLDLRISANNNSADGITLFWLDAGTVGDIATTIGGSGQWLGTPRGSVTGTPGSENNTSSYGWYGGLHGYAIEFDHYANSAFETPEYTALLNLSDWSQVPGTEINFSSDPDFYDGNGWQTVQIGYSAAAGTYTLSWGYNGSAFNSSATYSAGGMEQFSSAYFGIGGSTGGWASDQDVKNVTLTGTRFGSSVPEPGTWAAALILLGGAGFMRWRKRANCSGAA